MEIIMRGTDGFAATRMIRNHFGTLPVLTQTNFEEDERTF